MLEIYLSKKDWAKVHEVAKEANKEVQVRYSMIHALNLWKDGKLKDTLEVLYSYGASDEEQYLNLYISLAQRVLQLPQVLQNAKTVRQMSSILHK